MKASNFSLSITGNNEYQLNTALDVALEEDGNILAWKKENGWLILFGATGIEGTIPLPHGYGLFSVQDMVKEWLGGQPKDERSSPDIDGSVAWGGWLMQSGWGPGMSPGPCEVLRIRPVWSEYHK